MKRLTCFLVASFMLFALVACNGEKNESNVANQNENGTEKSVDQADNETDNKTENKETEAKDMTITVKSYFKTENPEAAGIAWHTTMDEFIKENPNVKFDEEILDDTSYIDKIKILLAAGDLPDVFQLGTSFLDPYLKSGNVAMFNDVMDDEWKSNLNQGAIDEFSKDGNIYGIPYRVDYVNAIIYNKKIIAEAGYNEFPKTFSAFEEMLGAIKSNGYIPITIGVKTDWYPEVCYERGLQNIFCGPEWTKSLGNKEGASFADPQFIEVLNTFDRWINAGYFNQDMLSLDFLQHHKYYYEGKSAMYFDGTGGVAPMTQECPQEVLDNTAVAFLPPVDGKDFEVGAVGTAGWSIAISSKIEGEKKDKAIDFIKAFTSPESGKIIVENGGNSAVIVEDFDNSKMHPVSAQMMELLSKTNLDPTTELNPSIMMELRAGLQEVFASRITPEELSKKLVEAYKSY